MPSIIPSIALGGAALVAAALVLHNHLAAAQESANLKAEDASNEEDLRRLAMAREAMAAAERAAARAKTPFKARPSADALMLAERRALVTALQTLRAALESTPPSELPCVISLPLLQSKPSIEATLLAALLLWGDWLALVELAWVPIFAARMTRRTPAAGSMADALYPPDARAIFGTFGFAGRLGLASSTLDETASEALRQWLEQLASDPCFNLGAPIDPKVAQACFQLAESMAERSCHEVPRGFETIVSVPCKNFPFYSVCSLLRRMGLHVALPENFEFSRGYHDMTANVPAAKKKGRNPHGEKKTVRVPVDPALLRCNRAGETVSVPVGALLVRAAPRGVGRRAETALDGLFSGSVLVANFDLAKGFICHDVSESDGNLALKLSAGSITAASALDLTVTDLSLPAFLAGVSALRGRFLVSYRARLLLQRLPPSLVGWSFEHCAASTGDPQLHGHLALPPQPDWVQDLKDAEVAVLMLGARGGSGVIEAGSFATNVLVKQLLSSVLPPPPASPLAASGYSAEEQAAAQASGQRLALQKEVEDFVPDYVQVCATTMGLGA